MELSFASKPNPAGDLKIGMAVVVGDISVEGNQISFSAYSTTPFVVLLVVLST